MLISKLKQNQFILWPYNIWTVVQDVIRIIYVVLALTYFVKRDQNTGDPPRYQPGATLPHQQKRCEPVICQVVIRADAIVELTIQ